MIKMVLAALMGVLLLGCSSNEPYTGHHNTARFMQDLGPTVSGLDPLDIPRLESFVCDSLYAGDTKDQVIGGLMLDTMGELNYSESSNFVTATVFYRCADAL